jgi:hypothetical protein
MNDVIARRGSEPRHWLPLFYERVLGMNISTRVST